VKTPAILQIERNESKIPSVLQFCEISKIEFRGIDLQRGRFLFLHSLGREPSITDGAGCFVLNVRNRDEHPGHYLPVAMLK
jgi:hypothetical protein